MERIDQLNQRLAEIQDELLGVPSLDSSRKYALQLERDALRGEAAKYQHDQDVRRPSSEMIAEVKVLKSQLASMGSGYVNIDQARAGEGGWKGSTDTIVFNADVDKAHGVEPIVHRIARLETLLKDRGHL